MIRKTFEELKLTDRLPSPSGVGLRILQLTQSENYSADEIGKAIMADSALTGRLLRIANSVQIAAVEPITTVPEATMRLGIRAVRNVALGLSLLSTNRSGVCQRFDYERYWATSLARAIAAQQLSRQVRTASPAEAYILGLLSEIGNLGLATVYPEKYSEILSGGVRDPLELARLEREAFEIDHSEVGAYMLEEWGLPRSYAEAVKHYERAGIRVLGVSPDIEALVVLLRAAQVLAEGFATALETADQTELLRMSSQLERLRSTLEMESPAFRFFCDAIAAEWVEWGSVLGIPTPRLSALESLPERIAESIKSRESSAAKPSAPPAESAPAVAASPEREVGSVNGSLRILAVDDDPMSLKLLERHLVKAGHQVRRACDGRAALQVALETNPQVVIADWMMPELDGIELCKALRRIESGRDMFFLLLTGRGEEDRVVEAFEAGVDDYIVKPFNPKILMARIKGGQRVIELKERVENDRQIMQKQVGELGLLTRQLETMAWTDVLTELPNRRYAMKRLGQEWETSLRTRRPLSVIMIDIDHFKKVNDVHGHAVGDQVLKETANVLRTTTRTGEEPSRLGGEEFLVICCGTTLEQAQVGANRIRAAVEGNLIRSGSFDSQVTVSLGIAEMQSDMSGIDALLKAADDAVYQAKARGRNRVCLAPSRNAHTKSA